MFSSVVVTKNKYANDVTCGGVIIQKAGTVKETQRVISVGTHVRDIKEGDLVFIDPSRYAVRKYREDSVKADVLTNDIVGYNIPEVVIDGNECLIIEDRDVRYIIDEYEEIDDLGVIQPNMTLIV